MNQCTLRCCALSRCAKTLLAIATLWSASAPAAVVNLSSSHNFMAPGNIINSVTPALSGLATLADFQAASATDRYVYSFETWPEAGTTLPTNPYAFQFDQNGDGVVDQRVTLKVSTSSGAGALTKVTNSSASSPSSVLGGIGTLGWGAATEHTYTFETPVAGAGVVYRGTSAMELRKAIYNGDNYPVSYRLSDGTVVNLGAVAVSGGTMSANANTFVGVKDTTGKGIVSVTFRVQSSVYSANSYLYLDDLTYLAKPEPAVQSIISLKSSHDFRQASAITASAATQMPSLYSLEAFRSDAATHNRFVYSFNTWPQATAGLGTNNYAFQFDLDGNGVSDQQVTVNYTGPYSGSQFLTKVSMAGAASPQFALGGLGDIGWGGSTYAMHTFTFQNPVSAAGVVYRSALNMNLRKSAGGNGYPVSYTLTDNTVVNLGALGTTGATIAANTNTFVGVKDISGKGIKSMTFRVQGTAGSASQFAYIDDLAFTLAGPPAGNWTLSLNEEFTGTALNSAIWSKGYRYKDVHEGELQAFVPENVIVANGMCSLKVEKRQAVNRDMYNRTGATQQYASGAIQTYTKWTQAYGYFEARMKMSGSPGVWPAFWMLPDRGSAYAENIRVDLGDRYGAGRGNEIDVVEFMATWIDPATSLARSWSNTHFDWGVSKGGFVREVEAGANAFHYIKNPHTEFHNYGVLWEPGQLTYYIDGKIVQQTTDARISNVPQYLILNAALEQNDWVNPPGYPSISSIDAGLPTTVDIEYVKVWSGSRY